VSVQGDSANQPQGSWARVEMAVGVLMQVCGWDATTARARLRRSADRSDVPVVTLAAAILGLFP
jgi:AmiR/NasT family two-component response regulator